MMILSHYSDMEERVRAWISEFREHVEASLTTEYTPRQTAASFAFAIFLAVLPTFGLAPLIAIGFAAWSERTNQYAMIAAFVLFNPFVLSGIYTLSFLIGDALGPFLPVYQYEVPLFQRLYLFTRNILLGTLILNAVLSTTGYVLALRFVTYYRSQEVPWDV